MSSATLLAVGRRADLDRPSVMAEGIKMDVPPPPAPEPGWFLAIRSGTNASSLSQFAVRRVRIHPVAGIAAGSAGGRASLTVTRLSARQSRTCRAVLSDPDALETDGGETRTTESIWTEIRLSCRENFARLAQGIVQRRFQYELRVREPAAAAADRVHRRAGQVRGLRAQAEK